MAAMTFPIPLVIPLVILFSLRQDVKQSAAALAARAAASVRMEAQTIMEMPMPKELADWGVLPATAQIRRTLTSFVRYTAPLSTPRLKLQAWMRSCGARSTGTVEKACWA